jgi:hypothetical protein
VNDTASNRSLVTIRAYRDLPDALIAQSILESAEIECFLADDNIVCLYWFYSYAVGGVKLRVSDLDASDAIELLSQPPIESFATGGAGDYVQPRCPNCGSLDLHRDELSRVAYASLFYFPFLVWLLLFVPFRRRGWQCHSCGLFAEEISTSK